MKIIIEQRIQILKDEVEEIKVKCRIYETCTDGSYEACLSYHGLHDVEREIQILSKEPNDNRIDPTI